MHSITMNNNEFNDLNAPPQALPPGGHRPDPEEGATVNTGGNREPRDADEESRLGMSVNLGGRSSRSRGGSHGSRSSASGPPVTSAYRNRTDDDSIFADLSINEVKEENMKEEFGRMLKDGFAGALKEVFGRDEEKSKPPVMDRIETASGLAINVGGARTVQEMQRGRRVLSRFERGEGASKSKLIKRLCVKLAHDFQLTDYGKLMSPDSDFDVASMTVENQEVIDDFTKFATEVDALDIFKIPDIPISSYSDIRLVMAASSTSNLLEKPQDIPFEMVKRHQMFVNLECDPVEAESSDMCKDVLEKSTESTLRLRVKQIHENLPKAEQGGITFFKILMDEAYKSSFESKQGLIKWMKAFDVRNYDGENVSVATTHFKAVLKALGEHAPPEPVRIMLKGLSQASNKEFQTLCHTQTGILDTVFYKRQLLSDKTTPAQEVDEFATIVVGRYSSLNLDMEWSGLNHKGSVFKASLVPAGTQGAFVADKPKAELPFTEWWDQQTCKLEGCGGRHPTRYHNDLGARNRPRGRFQRDKRDRDRPGSRSGTPGRRDQRDRNQRSVTFKSDEAKAKFRDQYRQAKHRIHQALADAIVDEDKDLMVNLAGDDDDDGFESAKEELEDKNDDDDEAQAMAHAAMSIDSLLNW
jgi:hypothetical protein